MTGAIWGMGFVAQQTAMDDMPAMLFIAFRFLLAAAVVSPLAWWESQQQIDPITPQQRKHFVILGCVFFLAMSAQQLGLLGTSVTNAGFLTTLYVVMVPLLLFVIFRQRQSLAVCLSAAVSLTGVFLLSGGDLSSITWGDWLVVLCALFWAVHVILVGKFARQTQRPITLATMQFLVCGLCGLAVHVAGRKIGIIESSTSFASLLAAVPEIFYAGVFSGGIAFTIQVVAQRHTSASIAAILMGTESLFAALFGAFLLGDRLNPIGYVGCLLIFAAVLMVELIPDRRVSQAETK